MQHLSFDLKRSKGDSDSDSDVFKSVCNTITSTYKNSLEKFRAGLLIQLYSPTAVSGYMKLPKELDHAKKF